MSNYFKQGRPRGLRWTFSKMNDLQTRSAKWGKT